MKRRTLREDHELTNFVNAFSGRGGADVSLDYLRGAKVRAFYQKGELVGGYVCNSRAPFRYLDWMPASEHAKIPALENPYDLCELTCLWVARNHQKSKTASLIIFSSACLDAMLAWRKYTLGGTLIKMIKAMQIQVFPNLIYHGPTPAGRECWCYYATRKELFTHYARTMIAGFVSNMFGTPEYMRRARKLAKREAQSIASAERATSLAA